MHVYTYTDTHMHAHTHSHTHTHTHTHTIKHSVMTTLTSGSASDGLLVCLSRLESHLATCDGQGLVNNQLSLADVAIWSTLYLLLAPEASDTAGMYVHVMYVEIVIAMFYLSDHMTFIVIGCTLCVQ